MDPMLGGQVTALEQRLEAEVSQVLAVARACPAGGSPTWDRVMTAYGAQALSPDERLRTLAEAGMGGGASPAELRRVLELLAALAARQLASFLPPQAASDPAVGKLRYRLTTLGDAEARAYAASLRAQAPPQPQGGGGKVSSIFANAKATAKQQPWKAVEYKAGYSYVCAHCGAPQQQSLDFICRHCGKPVAGPAGGAPPR
jgi:hypothetical protein